MCSFTLTCFVLVFMGLRPTCSEPTTTLLKQPKTSSATISTFEATIADKAAKHAKDQDAPTALHPIPLMTLEDFCRKFNLPKVNCTCKTLTVPGANGIHESACKYFPMSRNSSFPIRNSTVPIKSVLRYYPALSRPYAGVSTFSCIAGIIGNGVIILVAYYKRQSLSSYRLLITELAVSDFVFSIVFLINSIPKFWTNKWVYGQSMCKILSSSQVLSSIYSIGFILLIAIERYCGTLYGLRHHQKSKSFVYGLSLINIVTGFVSVIPSLIVLEVNDLGVCSENWPNGSSDSLTYDIFLTVAYFLVPITIIFGLYMAISMYVWKNTKENIALKQEQIKQRMEGNKRMIYTLLAILIAFVICVLPNRVVWIYIDLVNYKVEKNLYIALSLLAMIPYPFHLAVNPIIYTVIDKRWRSDIWAVVSCDENNGARGRSGSLSPRSRTSTTTLKSSSSSTLTCNFKVTNNNNKERNMSVDMGTYLSSSPKSPKASDDVFT